ncbi:undecaprenyl-diphosphate phosphatase [Bifidobacterium sp. ESL0763]|uniref:undecaprenyl-diphosphate phosphatase n=1 Tax=Bifidobacterium sp. ESL0763 TaxID=2983227 RepID=UPI0023F6B7F0|nr:undecaprenyl-diphosphate phosphatase [Bifidobacterium sp. ESL0763]MDF7663834.1 undecaprenyl-diphosphate phosphatase [Bifidobacterium sp. ESL0763]
MNLLKAIILGLVQALSAYAPVSSATHIRVLGTLLLGGAPSPTFVAAVQLGSVLAVTVRFRRDIARIFSRWRSCLLGEHGTDWKSRMGRGDRNATFGWYVIIANVPVLVLGVPFGGIAGKALDNLWFQVAALLAFGVLLWIVDARVGQLKTLREMTYRDALFLALGQMLALIPGVSLSAGALTLGRARGLTRESVVRAWLIMAIPAGLASVLYQLYGAVTGSGGMTVFPGLLATLVAGLVSFALGYVVIVGLLRFVSTFSLKVFAIYRIAFALVIVFLLLFGAVPAAASAM